MEAVATPRKLQARTPGIHGVAADYASSSHLVQLFIRRDDYKTLVHVSREAAIACKGHEPFPKLLVRTVHLPKDVDGQTVVREDNREEEQVEQEAEGANGQLDGKGEGGPAAAPS